MYIFLLGITILTCGPILNHINPIAYSGAAQPVHTHVFGHHIHQPWLVQLNETGQHRKFMILAEPFQSYLS